MGTNWVIVFIVGSVVGAVIMSLRFTLTQPVLRFGLTQPDSNKAKDDPFTGTWREKDKLAEMSKLIIKPGNDGLSFQRSRYQKPLVISYGKEFVDEYPFLERMEGMPIPIATVFRIDDHTLEFSYRDHGELLFKITYAVSSDGKHLKVSEEYQGKISKPAIYDRVGPVPEGDAFFGNWQPQSMWIDYTIKTDGETFDWYIGDRRIVKAKFDGNIYIGNNYSRNRATYQFKRFNEFTIKMVIRSERFISKEAWQVDNTKLTRTITRRSKLRYALPTRKTSVSEYMRIK
jgi:hypothetical protein